MAKEKGKIWTKTFRIAIIEDKTHRKISTWRFSVLGAIVIGVTALVVFFGGMYTLLAFTPLRTTIPGYPDGKFRRDAIVNAVKIDSLESAIARWELYSYNLRKVLEGVSTIYLDGLVRTNPSDYLKEKGLEEIQKSDSILRATVKEEEQYGVSGGSQRNLPLEGHHFFPPVKGVIYRPYDIATHQAVDISAPEGAIISSVLDGTVIYTNWKEADGYTIIIQHPGNIISSYTHAQKLLYKMGDKITAGTPVALLGRSGSLTDETILHFELWSEGESVDPTQYIYF